jgi:predicted nucleic acid-binding protein
MLKLVLPESDSDLAESLWRDWTGSGVDILAPTLMTFEAASGIRKAVYRDLLSAKNGVIALAAYLQLETGVILVPPDGLHFRAWELATKYQQPRMYDAYYVALAESQECPLWTSDERLRRAMPGVSHVISTLL